MFRRRIPVILCAVGSLWLIGCSSDSPTSGTGGRSTTSSSTPTVIQNTTTTSTPAGSTGTEITTTTTTPTGTPTSAGTTATTATTVPGRVVTSPSDKVKKGDSGDGVKKIQYALKSQGYAVSVDGKFGAQTDTAVRAFQKKNGLTQDGVVGPVTWAKLSGTKAPTATATTTKPGSTTTTTTIKP